MNSKVLATFLTVLFAVGAFTESAFAKCSDNDRRKGFCTEWGRTADISPSLPPGNVPKELLVETSDSDVAWGEKTWNWLKSPFSSNPIGKTDIDPNITSTERRPTAKKIPVLPANAESVDSFKSTFNPTQMKVYVKHNNNIQKVYKAEIDSYETLAKAKAQMEPIIAEIVSVEKEIQPLAQEADNCKNNPQGSNCDEWLELGGDQTTKKLGLLRRKSKELETSVKTAQANFDDAYSKYRDSRTEIDNTKQAVQDDLLLNSAQARDLEISLRRADVRNAFQETKFDLMTVDHKLDLLESELDRQDVGIYMQAKLGRLLTSNIFCQSTNKCVKGEKRSYKPEELRELFKELQDTSKKRERSRETYSSE